VIVEIVPLPAGLSNLQMGHLPVSVLIAGATLLPFLAAALVPEQLAPRDPIQQQLAQRLLPPLWEVRGDPAYILGTDQLGRDVLSRIIFGARSSLALGSIATVLSLVIGSSVGMLMGYWRGRLTTVLLRITDIQLAFPFLVLAIAIIALFGATTINLILVLVLWSWPSFARLSRAEIMVQREMEYVEAARAIGATPFRIVARDLLPNILPSLVVLATLTLAQMVIFESALGFLGFGVPPPTPSWGGMLSDARDYVASAWWLVTFPGVALMVVVLCVSVIGDYLEQRWQP
jgi:peptide/nickel transport system permease protein